MSSSLAVPAPDSSPNRKAYLALASVCFFWGTTYLGIRMALEGFSPMVLISVRFFLSGGILLAFLLWRRFPLPRKDELWKTALTGIVTIGGGNGFLTYAELIIPSGLAAIFITLAPFWFVGIDSLLPNGTKLHAPTLLGMTVGLIGAIILAMPGENYPVSAANLIWGGLLLQAGSALWAGGSMLQKRVTRDAHPFMVGAIQQLAVGLAFAPFAAGSVWMHGIHFEARATWALLYLVFFGAIVGYSSYIYALSHLPVAVVSLYNYVNPVVAVALGWLFYREPFGLRESIAMLVIFAGVALVKRFSTSRPPR
ncbi:MAG: EamA family transporter [Bryobacterales bacterium]|nr:EamA family transporter [Bryobacterales bacterium]